MTFGYHDPAWLATVAAAAGPAPIDPSTLSNVFFADTTSCAFTDDGFSTAAVPNGVDRVWRLKDKTTSAKYYRQNAASTTRAIYSTILSKVALAWGGARHLYMTGTSTLLLGRTKWSLGLWVRASSSASGYLFSECDGGGLSADTGAAGMILVADGSGKLVIYFNGDGGGYNTSVTSSLSCFDNTWHFIVVTMDSGVVRFFVDGVQDVGFTPADYSGDGAGIVYADRMDLTPASYTYATVTTQTLGNDFNRSQGVGATGRYTCLHDDAWTQAQIAGMVAYGN